MSLARNSHRQQMRHSMCQRSANIKAFSLLLKVFEDCVQTAGRLEDCFIYEDHEQSLCISIISLCV